jgi:hypothetical protein
MAPAGSAGPLNIVRREAVQLNTTRGECYGATSSRFLGLSRDVTLNPTLDQQRLARGDPSPRWPNGAPLAVCLTHDVDFVAWNPPAVHWRRVKNHLHRGACVHDARAARGLRSATLELGRAAMRWRRADPLHCYERWLQAEQRVGARSTFLLLPERYGRRHYSDGPYRYSDRLVFDGTDLSVRELMRELHRRGWEVGLHASWHTCDSVDEMRRQKEQVERAIDAAVISVRHHYLHFDVRRTPRVHHQAGLLVDSSIGFNDDVGFRCGTSYPWRLHDLQTDEPLNVLELPLILQDKCLIRMLASGCRESALRWAATIIDRVQAVGGLLTVLWHPCSIRDPMYLDVYEELLAMLYQRNAWFGTMADVARWWPRD